MKLQLIKQPSFEEHGVEVKTLKFLQNDDVHNLTDKVYSQFTPARNAENQLCRAVRWGILINDVLHWTRQSSYQLDAIWNDEEGGSTRYMDLIPDSFLNHQEIKQLIRIAFNVYFPNACSKMKSYVVQLSAIRYEPSLTRTCYPSPDKPHQDGFDNAIFVLNRTDNLIGGQTRVFDLNDDLVYEANLSAGQAVFVKDDTWKHQVLPMMHDTNASGPDTPCYRDILIVRISKTKR